MRATPEDAAGLAELVKVIWPEHTLEDLASIIADYMGSEESAVFEEVVDGQHVGVALCSLRHDYVAGCETSPVGYLEGISVHEAYQHRGIARRLVAECEQWAREKGCTEFGSDCDLDNTASLAFHLTVGFQEEGRIICFRKSLNSGTHGRQS